MKYTKQLRHTAAWLAVAWAVTALVACGTGGATSTTATAEAMYEAPAADYEGALAAPYEGGGVYGVMDSYDEAGMDMAYSTEAMEAKDDGGEFFPEEDRKIIMTASVTMESLEYEATTLAIERIINESGGYISSSGVYNNTVGSRNADYTIRVPAENYRALLQGLEEAGNVVSRSESSEDVTTQYIDVEARLTSLRAQEERLMELMAEAGDLESLILVQQQLSEVQYQIEYYEGTQRSYDRQIAHSTVYLHLYEVVEYTEPEPEGYLSQLGRAFRNGWKNALDAVVGLSLAIVGGLPVLVALAVVVLLLLLVLKRARKRSAEKLAALGGKAGEGAVTIKPEPQPPESPDTKNAAPETNEDGKEK